MTWSVNWDAAANCASAYEFATSYYNYFNSNLSVDEKTKSELIQIFPNPFDSGITINSPHLITQIKIFDINGKELYRQLKPETSKVNLTSLQSGLYILELKTESSIFYKKILKK